MWFKRRFSVKPNQIGYLYKNNIFKQSLDAGVHWFYDPYKEMELVTLPLTTKLLTMTNQEVLLKDSIAIRFSYSLTYRIQDGQAFLDQFELSDNIWGMLHQAEQFIHLLSQVTLRNILASYKSDEVNDKRETLFNDAHAKVQEELNPWGILVEKVFLRDLTFPKNIQDLFAKRLEANIKTQVDLEQARTVVATARAMKNASDLMKNDENIKFFQYLDVIQKIAAKGKHTFFIGDLPNGIAGNLK